MRVPVTRQPPSENPEPNEAATESVAGERAESAPAAKAASGAATPSAVPPSDLSGVLDEQVPHGWELHPRDDDGVRRGGTKLGQLRVWVVPLDKVVHITKSELGGGTPHPGLYLLLNPRAGRCYVGESHDLQSRLASHAKNPPAELGGFDFAIILNDGRNAAQSLFNDHTLRLALEQAVVQLLTDQSRWTLSNKVRDSAPLSISQKITFKHLDSEIAFALYQLRLVDRLPPKRASALPVAPIEAAGRFPGRVFADVTEFDGTVDGAPIYFRDGSDKSKVGAPSRWQVTVPFGEPFGRDLLEGRGFLCFNRGPVYLIPLAALKSWLTPKLKLQKADIFFDLDTDLLTTAGVAALSLAQFKPVNASNV